MPWSNALKKLFFSHPSPWHMQVQLTEVHISFCQVGSQIGIELYDIRWLSRHCRAKRSVFCSLESLKGQLASIWQLSSSSNHGNKRIQKLTTMKQNSKFTVKHCTAGQWTSSNTIVRNSQRNFLWPTGSKI